MRDFRRIVGQAQLLCGVGGKFDGAVIAAEYASKGVFPDASRICPGAIGIGEHIFEYKAAVHTLCLVVDFDAFQETQGDGIDIDLHPL